MAATTPAEANTAVVQRFHEEVFNGEDYDVLEETHDSDFIQHGGPGNEGELTGREAVEAYLRGLHDAFPDLTATIEATVAEDDLVATRLTYTATHEGEFMGVPPTGTKATIEGMVFHRIEDGKIAEAWVQVDTLGLMQALGVIEAPPT